MTNHEKVHYVINTTTGERVSKFYSKVGSAKNFIKKFPEHSREDFEAVTMLCMNYRDSLWVRIGRGFGDLQPVESSTYLGSKGMYNCSLTLVHPNTCTKITLETTSVDVRVYENQNP